MLNVEIISAIGVVFEGVCDMVVVPSVSGEIGVMQNHEAFVAQLKEGEVCVYDNDKNIIKKIEIQGGTAQINDSNRVLILID